MNSPNQLPVDSHQNQEEYEDRSRVSVFVFLAIFPLAIILIVAMTDPAPENTTHQMGEFFNKLNGSRPQPPSPDISADAKSQTETAAKSMTKTAEDSGDAAKQPIAIHERRSSARAGYFEGWSRWVRRGYERLRHKWSD